MHYWQKRRKRTMIICMLNIFGCCQNTSYCAWILWTKRLSLSCGYNLTPRGSKLTWTWTTSRIIDSEKYFIKRLTQLHQSSFGLVIICLPQLDSESDMAAELFWTHPDVHGLFPNIIILENIAFGTSSTLFYYLFLSKAKRDPVLVEPLLSPYVQHQIYNKHKE